jgi:O-antigen/teichoic acid export membrane protein
MMNAQLVTWTMALVLSVVVPRYLGPDMVGQFRLANSLWLLGRTLVAAGTTRYLQLEIARAGRRGLRLVGPVLLVRTGGFVVVAALLGVYAVTSGQGRTFEILMIIVAIDSLFYLWTEAMATAFVGLERMATPATVNVVIRVSVTLATLVVIILNGNVYAVGAAGGVGVALGVVILVRRLRPLTPIVGRSDVRHGREVLTGSLPFMFSGAALILYQQIDIIVISWTADQAAIGWYGTADSLFGSLLFPATVLTATIFPTLGRLTRDDPDGLRRIVQRGFTSLFMLGVPIGLGTVLVAPSFAPLLYGDSFAETGTVLAILGPVIILTFGTILFGTVAQATGRVRLWTFVLFAAALVTIPLDLVLVPWADSRYDNGAIGGAVAYVVTESLQFIVGLAVVAPFIVTRSWSWRVARTLAAGGIMFVVGWPLRDAFVLVPVAACAVVYPACLFAFRAVTEEERLMLGGITGRLGGRRLRRGAAS